MNEIHKISLMLENSPDFLNNLLASIPNSNLKLRRIPGKWSAHEHICHVCVGEKYVFHKRFDLFLNCEKPIFEPLSLDDFPENFYLDMILQDSLKEFRVLRDKTISLINSNDQKTFWTKEGNHPEYSKYTPEIMMNHLLMHDFWHFYRIEELLLANDGCIED